MSIQALERLQSPTSSVLEAHKGKNHMLKTVINQAFNMTFMAHKPNDSKCS